MKAPVAVHPLPLGEGKDSVPSLSRRERGEGERLKCLPFSSGKGKKSEVGPPCPARDVGHAQRLRGGDNIGDFRLVLKSVRAVKKVHGLVALGEEPDLVGFRPVRDPGAMPGVREVL